MDGVGHLFWRVSFFLGGGGFTPIWFGVMSLYILAFSFFFLYFFSSESWLACQLMATFFVYFWYLGGGGAGMISLMSGPTLLISVFSKVSDIPINQECVCSCMRPEWVTAAALGLLIDMTNNPVLSAVSDPKYQKRVGE